MLLTLWRKLASLNQWEENSTWRRQYTYYFHLSPSNPFNFKAEDDAMKKLVQKKSQVQYHRLSSKRKALLILLKNWRSNNHRVNWQTINYWKLEESYRIVQNINNRLCRFLLILPTCNVNCTSLIRLSFANWKPPLKKD